MEINKQLFEDVLSGKLKGTFILRNGDKVKSSELSCIRITNTYPIVFRGSYYTYSGRFALLMGNHPYDIIDFIPDTNMKENELTIEIPSNKVVDWDESKKQNKIVLKDKQLTYKDVCEKLFKDSLYIITSFGTISLLNLRDAVITDPNNATTEHQLECILAKNKVTNTALYLNDGWKPKKGECYYSISLDCEYNRPIVAFCHFNESTVYAQFVFKSDELAQQAIEILGEETIKLALEPLGI